MLMPPTAPITCLFFGALLCFSSRPASAPTMAPASCSLKYSDCTLECLRSVELVVGAGAVDDREVDVGELAGHSADGLLHEEADRDHEVVVLGGEVGQVGNVVVTALRLDDAGLELELGLGLLEAQVGEVVEALVVEAADVGDQADVVRLCGRGRGAAAGREERQNHDCHTNKPKSRQTHENFPLTQPLYPRAGAT